MALRGRRSCSALLVLIWALIAVVALATPASAAPPDPPAMQSGYDDVTVAYYESPFVAGTKPVGTSVVVQRVSDGSEVDCFGQDIPDLTAWTCSMSAREFPQDPDTGTLVQLTAHAVNAQEEESEKTPITLRIQPSRFGVTTSPDLPDGDRIVLEGSREMHAGGVRWTVTRDDDTLVSFQPCAFDDPDEGETFVCTYDSEATPAGTAAARPPGATAALASGSYTARLQEFADDGATDQIDEIVFAFTVGSPPAVAPPPSPPPPPTTQTPRRDETPSLLRPFVTTPTSETPFDERLLDPVPAPPDTEDEPQALPEVEVPAPASAPTSLTPAYDPLRVLIIGIIAFTTLAMVGTPGLAVAGRFAPGSTRTGGGAAPRGRWPRSDALRGAAGTTTATPVGLVGAAGGSVDGAGDSAGTDAETAERWGDRSFTWRAPGRALSDAWGLLVPVRVAPRFPLAARVLADGAHLRAALGSLWALTPVIGLVLGLAAAAASDGRPLAPGLALVVVLMIVAVLDAAAGFAAALGFAGAVLVSGGLTAGDLTLAQGARGLLGLVALWTLVPLIAGAARPFRRLAADGQVYGWDRLADASIAALLTGWAVQGVVSSLGDLVGRAQPITQQADGLALLAVGLVLVRFVVEEVVANGYPARLRTVHDHAEPPAPTTAVQVRGIAIRTALMLLFAWAFIGGCWQLWVGVAIFVLPQLLDLMGDRLPDVPSLRRAVPRGVVEVLVMIVIGTVIAYTIDTGEGRREIDAVRTGFVALALPGAVLGVLSILGGEPPEQRWTWPRQLAGAAVVVVAVVLVLVWL